MGQILYAQATGNASAIDWNTAANGSGDSAPWGDHLEDDTLEANGKTVELDVTAMVRSLLRNVGGGGFQVFATKGARTFVFDVAASSEAALTSSYVTDFIALTGDVTGGSSSGANGINVTSVGGMTIEGDVLGGSHAFARGATFIRSGAGGFLDVAGRCAGNVGAGAYLEHNGTSRLYDIVGGANGGAGVEINRMTGRATVCVVVGDMTWGDKGAAFSGGAPTMPLRPGRSLIFPDRKIYPAQATGILGVGV